jgi:hypothetical protein
MMAAILNTRNLIYWWVFITSFSFLQLPARELAKNLRNNQVFVTTSFPFNITEGFTRWLDDRTVQIVRAFQFDPNVIVIKTGTTLILDGYRVGLLLIVLLLILAVRYYVRAVASPKIYDDILALFICFFVYHLIAQTFKIIKAAPFGGGPAGLTLGDQLINERANWVWFLVIVILGMVLGGRGWADAKVFWKGVLELFFVWLFFIPQAAASGFATLLEAFAGFGAALLQPAYMQWAIIWAAIGFLLAVHRLYNAPPSAGRAAKSGGGKPAGAGASAAKNSDGFGTNLRRLVGK